MKKQWNAQSSFSSKLFLCILTTAFILLLIGGVILFSSSIRAAGKMSNELTLKNLNITGQNLNQLLQRADASVQMAFSQKDVLEATQKDTKTDLAARELVQHALITAQIAEDSIAQMSLSSDDDGVISSSSGIPPFSDHTTCDAWFADQPVSKVSSTISWFFLQKDPTNVRKLTFAQVRNIKPAKPNAKEWVLVVYMSEEYIQSTYSFLGDNSYIVYQDGTIISAVDKTLLGTKTDLDISKLSTGAQVQLMKQKDDEFTYAVYLPEIQGYLIVNIQAAALASTRYTMVSISLVVLALGLLLSAAWSRYIADTMTRPLLKLKNSMEEVQRGNFQIRCNLHQTDEIGYLGDVFNQMLDSLHENIRKINAQNNQIKENEIRLLQSQINPHLLYNTIDSAVCLLDRNETAWSKQVLETMSEYFKMALQRGNKVITVRSAVQHIESYLQLQKLCRMKNFILTVTGDKELLEAKILHMLLQPIVENSVLHGFEGHIAEGSIHLDLNRKEDKLILSIRDSGVGMDEKNLEILRQSLSASTSEKKGYALWNVVQRIKMYYGSEYGMEIFSELGEYTMVRMTIPYITERQEGDTNV